VHIRVVNCQYGAPDEGLSYLLEDCGLRIKVLDMKGQSVTVLVFDTAGVELIGAASRAILGAHSMKPLPA